MKRFIVFLYLCRFFWWSFYVTHVPGSFWRGAPTVLVSQHFFNSGIVHTHTNTNGYTIYLIQKSQWTCIMLYPNVLSHKALKKKEDFFVSSIAMSIAEYQNKHICDFTMDLQLVSTVTTQTPNLILRNKNTTQGAKSSQQWGSVIDALLQVRDLSVFNAVGAWGKTARLVTMQMSTKKKQTQSTWREIEGHNQKEVMMAGCREWSFGTLKPRYDCTTTVLAKWNFQCRELQWTTARLSNKKLELS